jgi:hypothetical protein
MQIETFLLELLPASSGLKVGTDISDLSHRFLLLVHDTQKQIYEASVKLILYLKHKVHKPGRGGGSAVIKFHTC